MPKKATTTKTRRIRKTKVSKSVISPEAREKMMSKKPDHVAKVMASLKGDAARLRAFLKANGCWVDGYEDLNAGMVHMNGANRLRALARKGHKVVLPAPGKPAPRRKKAAAGQRPAISLMTPSTPQSRGAGSSYP